jgi:hypothetical protein
LVVRAFTAEQIEEMGPPAQIRAKTFSRDQILARNFPMKLLFSDI